MFKRSIGFLFLFLSLGAFSQSSAEMIPERPDPPRLVNNLSKEFPNFFSSAEQTQLERKLSDFANQTSNQIVVVVVDDIAGLEAWDYATRLGHKWGVGQSKFDNGVVVLIKPTGGKGQRDASIVTGYGLGGAIPDLTCKRIVEEELGPGLANGNYFAAVDKTTDVLMALAKGEYDSDAYSKKNKKNKKIPWLAIIIVIIVFIYYMTRKGGGGMTMGGGGIYFGGGGFGGGWGGSGGGGGGFGGFGGGGFGGGGAGGKW